jgi:hypothetical protein
VTSTRNYPARRMRKTRERNHLDSALQKKILRKKEKMKRKMKIRTTRML